MRVVVSGGRDFTDKNFIWEELNRVHTKTPITELVHGGARGVDLLCREWAIHHDVTPIDCPADWDTYGKRAGMIRNAEMLSKYAPEVGIVFPGGRGTADMEDRIRKSSTRLYKPVYKSLWDEGAIFTDSFSNMIYGGHDAIVNTVNTMGVMGKGVALAIKNHYPTVYELYREMCFRKEIVIGRVTAIRAPDGVWVLNLPTKQHWTNPSRKEWIIAGLPDLRAVIRKLEVKNIGMPFPGCGNGKLLRYDIRPIIYAELSPLVKTKITLYQ